MRKRTRTISGVTPVAVMSKPGPCPGKCIYCPTFSATPQSYTPESPAVIRARSCSFEASEQVTLRLLTLSNMGHHTDKVELIIMGGTFLATPVDYQYAFTKGCYDALNGTPSKDLAEARLINETAKNRCVGLCIETRPDWCGQREIDRMLEFGTTRVELGVQCLDDEIYKLVNRNHSVQDVADATALLRDHGLKVHYHWMPGLPGSSVKHDLEMTRVIFDDLRFRPDGIKLYPTAVVEGTGLEEWYKQGKYVPYDTRTMINLVAEMKALVPPYVRISRVLRDIPSKFIVAGCKDSLRSSVQKALAETGRSCRCIRCREYGQRARTLVNIGEPRLKRLDYEASNGREIFLSFEDDNNTLFGLLRLRFQNKAVPALGNQIQSPLAIIRELHVYGQEVPLSEQEDVAAQHKGIGKSLMREAERIVREEAGGCPLLVLSGTGAREYYTKEFGYGRAGEYMLHPDSE